MSSGMLLLMLVLPLVASAQIAASGEAAPPVVASPVPRMIRIASTARDDQGNPLSGIVRMTVSLYKDQEGGVALWQETQNVNADANGRYSVLLGATKPQGLPLEIFNSGEARWLGIQPGGQQEESRILLLSVAYALKAADAETLGGKPLSAFVLAESPPVPGQDTAVASSNQASPAVSSSPFAPCSAVTSDGSGTAGQIAKFTTPCNVENSAIFESGGKVAIGNTAPGGALDVTGSALIRGELLVAPAGQATTSQGANSNPLDLEAQSYNTALGTGANYIFRWQAEPTGNDSTNTGATLNLLFGVPTSMSETGLSLSRTGVFTFAPGQTFPGNGTITGVTAGSGLTGGGTSGNVTLGLLKTCSTGQVLSWSGSAWVCSSSNGTITGVKAGPGLTGGGTTGIVTIGMPTSCANSQVLSWNGSAWVCSATGTGTITAVTAGSGLTGGGTSGSVRLGLLNTCAASQVLSWNGTAWICSSSGTGTITGVTAGSGLTGGGSSGNVSVSLLKSCAAGQVLAWNGGSWVCSALSIPAGATNGLAYFASPSVVTSTLAPTNGQILIGSTGKAPALGTLTAGPNISIANSAGQITISSSGNVATLPFFTTGGGVITAGKVAGLPNVNTVWGILLPYNVITTQVSYGVAVADNTANTYDLGLYNNSGGLVLDLGPVAGSKFSPTTGLRTLNWAQGATKLSAGRYYLGFTTNCASACAQLSVGALFVSFVSNAPGGHTSGGALPNLMSLPNDSWSSAGQPTVVIH